MIGLSSLRSFLRRHLRRVYQYGSGNERRVALAISMDSAIRAALTNSLHEAGWDLVLVGNAQEALDVERVRPVPLVFYEQASDAEWREEISRLADCAPRPFVIVLSKAYTKNLWEEVIQHGGADVLTLPALPDAVRRAAETHLQIWKCQRTLQQEAMYGARVRSNN